jgi:purine nucleosidase
MDDDTREVEPQARFRTAQDPSYRYQDARQEYRSEQLILSDRERFLLAQRLAADTPAAPIPGGNAVRGARKIILDTDIGTDIDDALALLLILHSRPEEVALLGITTVYGHSHLRARVAELIVRAFSPQPGGLLPLPIIAGESTPLGTHHPVWHTGTEGEGVLSPEEIEVLKRRSDFVVDNGLPPVPVPRYEDAAAGGRHDAARWIVEQVRAHPGEVTLVCIGALSNIAVALQMDPAIARQVSRIVLMGTGSRLGAQPDCLRHLPFRPPRDPIVPGAGVPWLHYPNINLVGDTLAALRVFESNIPIDVVGHVVTSQLWWGAPDDSTSEACRALRSATAPAESTVVGRLLDVWLQYRTAIFGRRIDGTCPHDPLTVSEAIHPGRFIEFTAPGHLMIHEWAAFGTFVCVPGGPHRLARSVAVRPFLDYLSARLAPATRSR